MDEYLWISLLRPFNSLLHSKSTAGFSIHQYKCFELILTTSREFFLIRWKSLKVKYAERFTMGNLSLSWSTIEYLNARLKGLFLVTGCHYLKAFILVACMWSTQLRVGLCVCWYSLMASIVVFKHGCMKGEVTVFLLKIWERRLRWRRTSKKGEYKLQSCSISWTCTVYVQ